MVSFLGQIVFHLYFFERVLRANDLVRVVMLLKKSTLAGFIFLSFTYPVFVHANEERQRPEPTCNIAIKKILL